MIVNWPELFAILMVKGFKLTIKVTVPARAVLLTLVALTAPLTLNGAPKTRGPRGRTAVVIVSSAVADAEAAEDELPLKLPSPLYEAVTE